MTDQQRPQTGHGPPIGTINVLEATIGQRGMGKSTYQCWRAFELVREHHGQAYVIGHSLGARLPEKLPPELGGAELPIEYHRSVENLSKALAERPTKWHILAPPIDLAGTRAAQDSCDDLIKFSIRLSESLRERAFARAHPVRGLVRGGVARKYDGLPCPFIVIIVDEGIAVESAASKPSGKEGRKQKDWFLQWIYSLRHYHTALFYAIQNAAARSWFILAEATRVVVFRSKHRYALDAIAAAGGTRKEMRAVKKLAPHDYVALGEDPRLADEDEDDEIENASDVDPDLDEDQPPTEH